MVFLEDSISTKLVTISSHDDETKLKISELADNTVFFMAFFSSEGDFLVISEYHLSVSSM